MEKNRNQQALAYHSEGRPGKIEVVPTKPYATQSDLSLAYSPGVAEPCLEIVKDPALSYTYTSRGNLVGVITNGTAVLGLGDIGPLASKPVMEGKCMLFKIFADIDAFDIEIAANNPDAFVETVKRIAPTFGAINLEDIKAPECFEIERRLRYELDIPVMHDDQHGTAVVTSAALLNSVFLTGKRIEELQIVVNGAGAAAIACSRLFLTLGIRHENLVMCDSKGVVTTSRNDLNELKREFATDRKVADLSEALRGADVFLGVSKGNILTADMARSMAADPLIMALANPDPEITYAAAIEARPDAIVATGRTDCPNQVNNALSFPYIFRGALDVQATEINDTMKLAAAHALAELARTPVPEEVLAAYGLRSLAFGRDYVIPKALDHRLLWTLSPAVAQAAVATGAARRTLPSWDDYVMTLRKRI